VQIVRDLSKEDPTW
jgi:hypothetical protein